MRLVRYRQNGAARPGLLDEAGDIRCLSPLVGDLSGTVLGPEALASISQLEPTDLPLVDGLIDLAEPVGNVGKVICVGLNYRDHAAEAGLPAPAEPVLFLKAPSSLCGPFDEILRPAGAQKLDWEVELAVVIGSHARNVSVDRALEYVCGYCVMNDVSERASQLEGTGQWAKGKSNDTFGPLGPWLVTRDAIANVQDLSMRLWVNGEQRQHGSTADMIFSVDYLVSFVSKFMSLQPGDIISTGTPAGVGLGRRPPTYLEPGDVIELEIENLGRQRQLVAESEHK